MLSPPKESAWKKETQKNACDQQMNACDDEEWKKIDTKDNCVGLFGHARRRRGLRRERKRTGEGEAIGRMIKEI